MRAVLGVIAAALVFGSGCAKQDWIDRTLVTVSVTGAWSGTMTGASGGAVVLLELQQQGAKVTGVINMPAYGTSFSGRVDGNVAGDVFTFKDDRGAYSGELTVAGDDMVGQIYGPQGKRGTSLRRGNSAAQADPPKQLTPVRSAEQHRVLVAPPK